MSPVVLGELLGWFDNTFTPMGSIMFKIVRISNSQFKCNYLKNEISFLDFLFHFSNLHHIYNILENGMIAIPNVFPKLQTAKISFRPLSKKRRFRTRCHSQHVKASQILLKSS